MTRAIPYGLAGAALAFALVSPPARAQSAQAYDVTLKDPGGPAPRDAAGHPDLSGVWWPNRTGIPHVENRGVSVDPRALRQFDRDVTPEAPPVFQPWAQEQITTRSATQNELSKLSVNCVPRGLPAIWLSNTYAIQFVQTPGLLVQLIEVLNNFRVIHTDGRPHPEYPDPLFHGNPSARWEGDDLVISSIAFDERTFINNSGSWFHSDELKVTERITRPSRNYLRVQVTVEDPKVLARPWTSAPRQWSLTEDQIQEYYCTHNPDVEEFEKIVEIESQGR